MWILEKYNDTTLKRGIANLGRSHAYRVFLTISINFHKPMSVQYIFSIAGGFAVAHIYTHRNWPPLPAGNGPKLDSTLAWTQRSIMTQPRTLVVGSVHLKLWWLNIVKVKKRPGPTIGAPQELVYGKTCIMHIIVVSQNLTQREVGIKTE